MSLPILKSSVAATPQTLMRFFHQTELQWTRHLAEETQLDFGTAMHNTQLPRTYMANRMLDAALRSDMAAEEALTQADAHFAAQGVRCWQWVMNSSASDEQTLPLVELLEAKGYTRDVTDVMHLQHLPSLPPLDATAAGLTIIPARASYRHARQVMEESARTWDTPELADAGMMHLDDPHYDALVALHDGVAAAFVGVLAMGEVGLVEQVHVCEKFRGRGYGKIMMSRAMEVCARSLFKHVLLGVLPTNDIGIRLYRSFGFQTIGQFAAYQARP